MTRTCESGLLILKSVTLPSLAELALLAVLLLCALYDLTLYTNTHLSARKIQLTPAQKRLLGVNSTGECALYTQFLLCCSADDRELVVLQWSIGKGYWSVRWEKCRLVGGMWYKYLWDYKSVTVGCQGFLSEIENLLGLLCCDVALAIMLNSCVVNSKVRRSAE